MLEARSATDTCSRSASSAIFHFSATSIFHVGCDGIAQIQLANRSDCRSPFHQDVARRMLPFFERRLRGGALSVSGFATIKLVGRAGLTWPLPKGAG